MKKLSCIVLIFTMLLISLPFNAFALSNDTRTYLINIHTLNEEDSSTNGDVYLKLYGDKGETAFWKVSDDTASKTARKTDRLQADDRLSFIIKERDVGKIAKVELAYYQSGKDDNTWAVDYLEIDGAKYSLKKVLLAQNGYPCVLTAELAHPENAKVALNPYLVIEGRQYDKLPEVSYETSYSVKIKTGNSTAAQTDEIVHLQLVGSNGESDWLTIDGNNGNVNNVFNRDTETSFFISGQRDIGKLKEVRIKMGSTGNPTDKGWLLESVTVESEEPYLINQWLQNGDYLSAILDAPLNIMLIKSNAKTSASVLSTPILVVIVGGSLVILATALVAVFIVKRRKHETDL
ncbi:MAG: PLAT/LH2 domain-containing protein [Oscillospiraceae bacterium]